MIKYFTEDIKFAYKGKAANNRWLRFVAGSEMKKIGDVNIIFCSDNYLLDINMKYLQHDYFTDIITFDYCEGDTLSGDLFISIDSVRENAGFYKASFETELRRVMNAFKYGAPPHGGLAYGLDRFVSLFAELDSIRDCIAFPKNNSGRDVMLDAPGPIDQKQMDELCIRLK